MHSAHMTVIKRNLTFTVNLPLHSLFFSLFASCSLLSFLPVVSSLSSLSLSLHLCPVFSGQVGGGEQGVLGGGADARRAGQGLGHVGRLPGEHLRQGAPAAAGCLGHHLLPARLPAPEREQVSQVPGQGETSASLSQPPPPPPPPFMFFAIPPGLSLA